MSFVLAVHGGAGGAPSAEGTREYSEEARAGLAQALAQGGAVLEAGGAALDAVVTAVIVLEACPAFNAGTGSVLNAEGEVEMDAAVMEGATRGAGAVALVRRIAHPVAAARAVMRDGRHVLLGGEGAEAFARAAGLPAIDPAALVTSVRVRQLGRVLAKGRELRAREPDVGGTVGAVALDADGHLAAATSTGGMTGKRPGRISDSALVGAGTWADDATCALSATGHGEYFIRAAFAARVDARLRHTDVDVETACRDALTEVSQLGGGGGCIAVDPRGVVALPFDTPGMPRGVVRSGEVARLAVQPGEALAPSD